MLPTWGTATFINPATLFAGGVQGAWYDPSDNTTMFQDAAGTTPVTAVEQAVGLILDKRNGLGIGTEVISNNTFDSDTVWTKGTGWSIGSGVATKTAGSAANLSQTVTLVAGTTYRLVYTITRTAGSITPQFTGGTTVSGTARSAAGTYVENITAVTGNTGFQFAADATFAGTVDNVYLKSVSGNDAYQTTSASRPTLRARYNLLTYSEEFNNAAWVKVAGGVSVTANATTDPLGGSTADKLIGTAANTSKEMYSPAAAVVSGASYVVSVYAKAAEYSWIYVANNVRASVDGWFVNLSTGQAGNSVGGVPGTISITDAGNGWWRISITKTASTTVGYLELFLATANGAAVPYFTGDGTSGIFIWGGQLVPTAVFPSNTYQRIAAATDYATGPQFPQYLAFDGTDDSLLTASVDFTGTDKMTVFSGLSKLSDAAQGAVVELSATIASNNGTFLLAAPDGATQTFGWDSKGTTQVDAVASSVAAPRTSVVTGTADISGDSCVIRVNGAVADTETGDQGTGNFGNYPLFIGSRNQASLRFNGRIYSLIVRGAASNTTQVAQTEKWVASKTPLWSVP